MENYQQLGSHAAVLLFLTFSIFSHQSLHFSEAQLFFDLPSLASNGNSSSPGLQFKQTEALNGHPGSFLEWKVDQHRGSGSAITFNLYMNRISIDNENSVLCLGLSKTGQVEGSDVAAVILGGMDSVYGKQPYLLDMHGVDNSTIESYTIQNWRLTSFQRNTSHLSISISRLLDTCDDQDIAIYSDLLQIIWGISRADMTGSTSSLKIIPKGTITAYLVDPIILPNQKNETEVLSWRVSRRFQVPSRHTTYWCSIHRGPELSKKNHIFKFETYLKDDLARKHIHHQLLHRCYTPPGVDPALFFEKFVLHPGEECYFEDTHYIPTAFCTEMMYVWGVGGKPFNLPENVGFSVGETRHEYYMLQTHYDNPEMRSDLVIENGVDFFYTSRLRENEGSLIYVGPGLHSLYQLPPGANNFTVTGHCSSKCTKEMVPSSGMGIIATMLHSHETGRKITVKHFRGNQELPWILSDHNYDFEYQQMRLLPEAVTVLPGDHLATECVFDTSSRNRSTVSAFSTREEMCLAFIILNKRLPYFYCSSEYPTKLTMERYGIRNMTWNKEGHERVINAANNPSFVGRPLTSVMDEVDGTSWPLEKIRALEREQQYAFHESSCPPLRYIMKLGHGLRFTDEVTRGLIPGNDVVERFNPNTRTISTTLLPIRTTRYPISATMYEPRQFCNS